MARILNFCPLCGGKLQARKRRLKGYISAWNAVQTVYECAKCKVRALAQKLSY